MERELQRRATRSAPWTGWLLALMTAMLLVYAVDIAFHVLPSNLSELFQKFVTPAMFFAATLLCLVKGGASRDERSAWWLFALAMGLWGTAQTYWVVVLWGRVDPPFPSPADALWIAFYLPAHAALYKMLRIRSGPARRKGVGLDALVCGLGVGGAGAVFAFQPVLESAAGSTTAIATNLAYPLGDLGLLGLVVAALTITGWKVGGVLRLIATAFATFAVSDSVYLVAVAQGSYHAGDLVDFGWPAAALIVGIAAWRSEERVRVSVRPPGTIAVPALFGLVALALLLIDHFVHTNPLTLALATTSIFVILLRLYLTVQDNARLLAQSRREAYTDALTGLGNRRQLTADLATHLEELDRERPLMLTLFDLDGFKHYNDTFGHLAGDQLLERLGSRLSHLLDGRGTGYRMGGDEFCAVWNLLEPGQASVTAIEAVAALSEHGDGFSIGCSYGSVLVPNETTDITDALRTADRRMYSRKASGRVSAGRQSSDVLLTALAECDPALGLHMGDVAELACATATRLDVPVEEMEAVRQTALLHDVGKVAIPNEILRKPERLDESEWAFMKRHTIIGERIIAAAPALTAVAKFVRSTHEHYDGDGYPDGLAGDDIPLIARIVSVCDAYDAMITDRAYRRARDRSTAVAELRRCSGTQFDPEVVEAFVSALQPMALRSSSRPPLTRPGDIRRGPAPGADNSGNPERSVPQ